MFCIVDKLNNFTPVKSGFKTSAQANNWAKKNLPKDETNLWGAKFNFYKCLNKRYFVRMR
jgi:hypothetical protein